MIEPDRPHNFGGALRLAACLGIELHLVEPAGFPLSDRRIREGALDYARQAAWFRHPSFAPLDTLASSADRRLLLLTTKASRSFADFTYRPGDILMLGSESRGAPDWAHARAEARLHIPMRQGIRSLNVLSAATIVLSEAMRQTGAFAMLQTKAGEDE
ncbi:tRNA (cytidine(34)-2'-O)-methyltransferase [Arboricoccus pini]|nr:TrmH family RNA methyltransferase [Arboricoccus pini]